MSNSPPPPAPEAASPPPPPSTRSHGVPPPRPRRRRRLPPIPVEDINPDRNDAVIRARREVNRARVNLLHARREVEASLSGHAPPAPPLPPRDSFLRSANSPFNWPPHRPRRVRAQDPDLAQNAVISAGADVLSAQIALQDAVDAQRNRFMIDPRRFPPRTPRRNRNPRNN